LENGEIISHIFALMLPLLNDSAHIFVPEQLLVTIAELIASLTIYVTEANLMQPLIVDPMFKHLPSLVSKTYYI
jgi:hypothetical protein